MEHHAHSTTSMSVPNLVSAQMLKQANSPWLVHQDSHTIIGTRPEQQDDSRYERRQYGEDYWTIGVLCDGHGQFGQLVSSFLVHRWIQNIDTWLRRCYAYSPAKIPEDPSSLFSQMVLELHQQWVDQAKQTRATYSGSTFVAFLCYENARKLWFLNVGDSMSLCFEDDKRIAYSARHDESNVSEMKRVHDAGGAKRSDSPHFYLVREPWHSLAMTRCLGNHDIPEAHFLLQQPEISFLQMRPGCTYKIWLCSDGIWPSVLQEANMRIGLEQKWTAQQWIENSPKTGDNATLLQVRFEPSAFAHVQRTKTMVDTTEKAENPEIEQKHTCTNGFSSFIPPPKLLPDLNSHFISPGPFTHRETASFTHETSNSIPNPPTHVFPPSSGTSTPMIHSPLDLDFPNRTRVALYSSTNPQTSMGFSRSHVVGTRTSHPSRNAQFLGSCYSPPFSSVLQCPRIQNFYPNQFFEHSRSLSSPATVRYSKSNAWYIQSGSNGCISSRLETPCSHNTDPTFTSYMTQPTQPTQPNHAPHVSHTSYSGRSEHIPHSQTSYTDSFLPPSGGFTNVCSYSPPQVTVPQYTDYMQCTECAGIDLQAPALPSASHQWFQSIKRGARTLWNVTTDLFRS